MSHTWHPYEQAYSTHNHPTRFWETEVFDDTGTVMATSHGASEEEANEIATLVAAAPQLLQACKDAIYAIKGREHVGFLENAIAKAEGRL